MPSPIEELMAMQGQPMDMGKPLPTTRSGLSPEAEAFLVGEPPADPTLSGAQGTEAAGLAAPQPPMFAGGMGGPALLPAAGTPSPLSSGAPTSAPLTEDLTGDLTRDFWARHGRAPTAMDIQAMHMVPMLEQVLGRPPMRIEVLQMLGARQETPASSPDTLQFEPDILPTELPQMGGFGGS